MSAQNEVKTWNHSRKGQITGTVVRESADGTWLDIEMATEGTLRLASKMINPHYEPGDVITVRKAFLTEIV